ncbi:hypothetical protein [Streptosporangium canum]|uniref:hypothetical protein n=1 Tax=Streptosporangium canum TaxID=324952 RepID=UPI0037B76C37
MVTPAKDPLRRRGRRRRGAEPARADSHGAEPAASPDSATELARDLESGHPGWVILWRRWARRYWAFPLWTADVPAPIEARHVQDLLAQMNEVELQHSPPGIDD